MNSNNIKIINNEKYIKIKDFKYFLDIVKEIDYNDKKYYYYYIIRDNIKNKIFYTIDKNTGKIISSGNIVLCSIIYDYSSNYIYKYIRNYRKNNKISALTKKKNNNNYYIVEPTIYNPNSYQSINLCLVSKTNSNSKSKLSRIDFQKVDIYRKVNSYTFLRPNSNNSSSLAEKFDEKLSTITKKGMVNKTRDYAKKIINLIH